MLVAIDGPAGSGKSSVARAVARRLGFLYLDTGALYRAFTLLALRRGVDLDDGAAVARLVEPEAVRLEQAPHGLRVFLEGEDVSREIRGPAVTAGVSAVAAAPAVRERVTDLARALAHARDAVTDGRDTTTVIFPGAQAKFFIDASAEERARRRLKDIEAAGRAGSHAAVLADLERRDRADRERSVGPLRQAEDAAFVDTTDLPFDAVVDRVCARIEAIRAALPAHQSASGRGGVPPAPSEEPSTR